MTSWPRVQFVDSPSVSATVRYDFNDDTVPAAPRWVANEGGDFTLGVTTLSGSPDSVGQSFGFRSPSFKQRVKGSKAAALSALSALSRELLRPTNWLLFQLDASTAPVWLRIYRSGFEPLSLNRVTVNRETGGLGAGMDAWEIAVPLVADAFAYGTRVTIPTVQIVQSPADLAGPTRLAMRYVLPPIKGDAPTPLRVTITPATGSNAADKRSSWLVGSVSGSASAARQMIDIGTGDGFTAGAGTGAGTTDTAYFNGSYRLVTVSAGAGNVLQRLSGTMPVAPRAGRYKILLRCTADGVGLASKPYVFGLSVHPTFGTPNYAPSVVKTVNPDASANVVVFQGWVDLGDFYVPAQGAIPRDLIDATLGNNLACDFALKVGTSDGSAGTVRIDELMLLPIDGPDVTSAEMLYADVNEGPISSGVAATFDGDSESFYALYTVTGNRYLTQPAMRGGFPTADPGAAQNLLVIAAIDHGIKTSIGSTITSKDAQAALDVSYYPRYLHIGDGT